MVAGRVVDCQDVKNSSLRSVVGHDANGSQARHGDDDIPHAVPVNATGASSILNAPESTVTVMVSDGDPTGKLFIAPRKSAENIPRRTSA